MALGKNEKIVWSGSPSQLVNIPKLLVYYIFIIVPVCSYSYFENKAFLINQPTISTIMGWIVFGLSVVFLFLSLHCILSVKYHKFILTNERFAEYKGITRFFNAGRSLELYKVVDHSLPQPGFGALFNLGKVQLLTNDADQPVINIFGIPDHENVFTLIRTLSEKIRMEKKGYFE
ncbi:MAG: hypothetical protein ACRBCS_15935 [Cellvibrionaceae bacterium]